MRRLRYGPTIAVVVLVAVFGALSPDVGIRADDPDAELWSYNITEEGVRQVPMPAGLHYCRLRANYPSEGLEDSAFMTATAWLVDENHGRWTRFDWTVGDQRPNPVYIHAGNAESYDTASDDGKADLAYRLAGLNRFPGRFYLVDSSPRLMISLSWAFRQSEIEWAFQCVEVHWPEHW